MLFIPFAEYECNVEEKYPIVKRKELTTLAFIFLSFQCNEKGCSEWMKFSR